MLKLQTNLEFLVQCHAIHGCEQIVFLQAFQHIRLAETPCLEQSGVARVGDITFLEVSKIALHRIDVAQLVVDIFDKAVNIKTDDEKLQKFLSGFVMVNKTFKQILERNGVEQIDALNKPFTPTYHSAIETVKVEGVEPNTVVEVIMTGYTYKDRVLRPSMVKVSE